MYKLVTTAVLPQREDITCKLERMTRIGQVKKGGMTCAKALKQKRLSMAKGTEGRLA